MRYTTIKRFGLVAAIFVMAGAASACADEPMAPSDDDVYEVQMTDEATDPTGQTCIYINGSVHCN